MRITALLRKIHELASQAEPATAIDVDLMLDYTRILYSDLLEWRENLREQALPQGAQPAFSTPPAAKPAPAPKPDATPMQEPEPEPPVSKAAPPEPAEPAELTLEEYMALHAGTAIHREPPAQPQYAAQETVAIAAPVSNVPAPASVDAPVMQPVEIAVQQPEPPAPVTAPVKPARDIRSMIGINDKYQIMSELFGNDKAAYEEALDMINRAESEQAAFNWLRERLWVTEDHSDAAMIFFDVVRRFKTS